MYKIASDSPISKSVALLINRVSMTNFLTDGPVFKRYFKRHSLPNKIISRRVRLSIRVELGSRWTDVDETRYFNFSRKSVETIQVSFKFDNNNWYFTQTRFNIFDGNSLNSS